MKMLLQVLRMPPGTGRNCAAAHHIWMALALTGLGCYVGRTLLNFSARVLPSADEASLLKGFGEDPIFFLMNCLGPVLLIWLCYFLLGRAWAAYLGCALPMGAIVLVNYYKINLRADPFLAADLRLISEAGNIVKSYDLTPNEMMRSLMWYLLAGLAFALLLMPRGVRSRRVRLFGGAVCLSLLAVALNGPYRSDRLYNRADNSQSINAWSPAEVYVSKGCVYSFLHSVPDLFPKTPQGYHRREAEQLLASRPDSAIPAEQQVSVMAVMLEAFCDLTDFEELAAYDGVREAYAPWHSLERRAVSGDLLTNIFAGGTVDTEWSFLTGSSMYGEFRVPTESYVWYFRDQGYQTFGSHPGNNWFYNRQNVNRYLGFQEYRFLEDYFSQYMTQMTAMRDSDQFLLEEEAGRLAERMEDGPCFSFSVTYQNHGPYTTGYDEKEVYITPAETGYSEETCHIFNNYLNGVTKTIRAAEELTGRLEAMRKPVVLVLFGDHKPWAGNDMSAYEELGVDFDLSTEEGFRNYYSTPYLIWANSAAKKALNKNFTGDGKDISPCFLMTELFDQCGWEGPGFMKLSREMREISPLVHARGIFWTEDGFDSGLEGEDKAFYRSYRCVEYYREREKR